MADCHHRGAFQPPARRCRGEGAVGLQEKLPEADLNVLARIEIAGVLLDAPFVTGLTRNEGRKQAAEPRDGNRGMTQLEESRHGGWV